MAQKTERRRWPPSVLNLVKNLQRTDFYPIGDGEP